MSDLIDILPVKRALVDEGWKSPDTYSNCFDEAGNFPAIYLFMLHDRETLQNGRVAYVGMSRRLALRWSGHEILRDLKTLDHWTMRWFKPVNFDDLRATEKLYIKKFDPPWNIAGRRRGISLK